MIRLLNEVLAEYPCHGFYTYMPRACVRVHMCAQLDTLEQCIIAAQLTFFGCGFENMSACMAVGVWK